MTEDGGSLRCAEPKSGAGSSFVISLPAARVSTENYHVHACHGGPSCRQAPLGLTTAC